MTLATTPRNSDILFDPRSDKPKLGIIRKVTFSGFHMSEKSNPDTSITMRKTRDNLPLFNLTTAIRKFYSREETQDSFPAIEFESSRFDIFLALSVFSQDSTR